MEATEFEDEKGFAVEPISNCPHVLEAFQEAPDEIDVHVPCSVCGDHIENWLCCTCYQVFCGRYVKGHGLEHFQQSGHPIFASFADLSFWCHSCQSYIKHLCLSDLNYKMHMNKFGCAPGSQAATPEELKMIFDIQRNPGRNKLVTRESTWWLQGIEESVLDNPVVDKILGVIYGNALGDAYGLATEFVSQKDIQKKYGASPIPFPDYQDNMHNLFWEKGDWTDDTDQLILIMDTIVQTNRADPVLFATKLRDWVHHGFQELGDTKGFGVGETVSSVVQHPSFTQTPDEVANGYWIMKGKDAAANGAIMRTSVLGCWEYTDIKKVIENTVNICKSTHADTRCIASCVVVTSAIALLLQGNPASTPVEIEVLIDQCLLNAWPLLDKKYEKEFLEYAVKDSSEKTLEDLHLDQSTSIGYTLKCMGSALWGLCSTRSFEETLNLLIKQGGDADTNGAVCGALLGCKLGYKGLPRQWLESMPNKGWLDDKVVLFLKAMKLI